MNIHTNADFGSGRRANVLTRIMPRDYFHPLQGEVSLEYDRIEIWADAGLAESFRKIEGILHIGTDDLKSHYVAFVDPRYDVEFVKREIEAVAILPKEETNSGREFKYIQGPGPIWNELFNPGTHTNT